MPRSKATQCPVPMPVPTRLSHDVYYSYPTLPRAFDCLTVSLIPLKSFKSFPFSLTLAAIHTILGLFMKKRLQVLPHIAMVLENPFI